MTILLQIIELNIMTVTNLNHSSCYKCYLDYFILHTKGYFKGLVKELDRSKNLICQVYTLFAQSK